MYDLQYDVQQFLLGEQALTLVHRVIDTIAQQRDLQRQRVRAEVSSAALVLLLGNGLIFMTVLMRPSRCIR